MSRRGDPSELTPIDARDRYLRRRQVDATDESLRTWRYRLKLFVEWCEALGIQQIGDLEPYDLDEYNEIRGESIAPATLEGEMWTLKMFVRFLEDLGAVQDDLSEAVRIPDIDPEDRSDDTKLHTDAAIALLRHYRNDASGFGTRLHVVFELAWVTGARLGGLRSLDLRDVDLEEDAHASFRHRAETETPLKNKTSGERPVALPEKTADALERYIGHHRVDVQDDHGRGPLLASNRGRPGRNTLRVWAYNATIPCRHGDCPHGREPEDCEWTDYHHSSKCPSSRSPHQIRTGAITYLLNAGWQPEDVAERVNSSVEMIEQHYDKADPEERRRRQRARMESRRRTLVNETIFDHDP